jgi:hypothetical protein
MQRTFGDLVEMPNTLPVENPVQTCTHCHRVLDDPASTLDGTAIGLGVYCGSCGPDYMTPCVECSNLVARDSARYALRNTPLPSGEQHNQGPYCEACFTAHYVNCHGCGCQIELNTSHCHADPNASRNRFYCDHCFSESYMTCAGCGAVCHIDSVAYTDEYDGDMYCHDCAPDDEDDESAEWHQGRHITSTSFKRIRSQRKYGVELEISGCNNHSGLRGETVFGVKYDGSLTSGKEFVSPVLQGDDGLDAIENLCEFGRVNHWTVDNSCGYHLHMDFSTADDSMLTSVVVGYLLTEQVWKRFISKRRGDNSYCKGGNGGIGSIDRILQNGFAWLREHTNDRYQWFNWQSYRNHRTLEIRVHSGTTNAKKVINWIKANLYFADKLASMTARDVYTKLHGKTPDEQFAIMAEWWNDAELADYYAKRSLKHKQPLKSPDLKKLAVPVESIF